MGIILCWSLTALFSRVIERSWWSPGALLALSMWVSAVGTITMAPEYYMSFLANLYLIILTLMASYGAALGSRLKLQQGGRVRQVCLELQRPKFLLYFGLLWSLVSFTATLQVIGVGLSDLLSPIGIMRAAQAATFKRYTSGLSFPIYYNISNALFLSYAMAITLHFVARKRIVWSYMTPVMIYVASNMLITTRAPILFMILIMVFSAVYAAYLFSAANRLPAMFSPRVIKYIAIGVLSVAAIFFLFQVLRFGEHSTRSNAEVWEHLRRWPWGSLPGFSLWFDNASGNIWDRVPGSYTWMGIFDQLRIEKRVVGGFGDYLFLTPTEAANIYTLFRGLYLDFGWVGSGIFMFLVGFAGGLSLKTLRMSSPLFAMSIYVAVSGLVCFAFVVSFWAFTANILALLIFPFLARKCFVQSRRTPVAILYRNTA
jgi:oligosaccharide repeat unit polymerase